MAGFGATHVGVLSDAKAIDALARALDESTAAKP
jgi:hypothetical protein